MGDDMCTTVIAIGDRRAIPGPKLLLSLRDCAFEISAHYG